MIFLLFSRMSRIKNFIAPLNSLKQYDFPIKNRPKLFFENKTYKSYHILKFLIVHITVTGHRIYK